jgi:hypothetical protein
MKLIRTCLTCAGFALTFVAFGGQASAVDIVPELNPGSFASALTLLAAGSAMLLASRRQSK